MLAVLLYNDFAFGFETGANVFIMYVPADCGPSVYRPHSFSGGIIACSLSQYVVSPSQR